LPGASLATVNVGALGVAGLALVVSGCGHHVSLPDELTGRSVASMAEHELEAENPRLTHGALRCPDLDFRPGASVRCVRTTTLDNGRVVKVGGTVRVTSMASGGRLHVAMDPRATEFGVTGAQVATELRRRSPQLFRQAPGAIDCPYLRGQVGARASCVVHVGGARHVLDAVVTRVDAASYDVSYAFRPRPKGPSAPPS
jgi:hypothetical protein